MGDPAGSLPASSSLHCGYGRQGQARFAGAWQGLSKSSLRVIPRVPAGGDRVAPTGPGKR